MQFMGDYQPVMRKDEQRTFEVAPLLLGRDGIVDKTLHPMILQIMSQLIPALGSDGEDVKDMGVKIHYFWQSDEGIVDVLNIILGDSPTIEVVGI